MLTGRQRQLGLGRALERGGPVLNTSDERIDDEVAVALVDVLTWYDLARHVLNAADPTWKSSLPENERSVLAALTYARGQIHHAHSIPFEPQVGVTIFVGPIGATSGGRIEVEAIWKRPEIAPSERFANHSGRRHYDEQLADYYVRKALLTLVEALNLRLTLLLTAENA